MLGERFDDALTFASQLHRKQVRKQSGIPYISHLLAVAALVIEYGGREEEAIAALLHDAIEDQSDTWPGGAQGLRQEITKRYGESVAAIIEGCTDTDTIPKPPWRERKERYLEHLVEASPAVLLVACCDKLHNLRSTLADYRTHGEALWKRFNAGKPEQLWFYRSLAEVFSSPKVPPQLAKDFRESVHSLIDLAGADSSS